MSVTSLCRQLAAVFFFYELLISGGDCQSFLGSWSNQRRHEIEFPTERPLQQSPQGLQFTKIQKNSSLQPPFKLPTPLHSSSIPSNKGFDQTISDKISRNVMQLGQEILTKIDSKSPSKTQVFSPTSIVSALALLLLGSNGQTYKEMSHLFDLNDGNFFSSEPFKLHEEFGYLVEDLIKEGAVLNRNRFLPPWRYAYQSEAKMDSVEEKENSNPSDYHQIRVANGVFIQNGYSLRPDYETAVKNVYKSEITTLDFHKNPTTAKNYINNWVDQKTHGKIKTIISDEIAPETNVIIASALYFKALWEKGFLGSATQLYDFYPNGVNASPIKVEMMGNGGIFPFYDAKEYGCRIIGLPYKGNVSTMYIIQPYNSDAQKLRQLQTSLTVDKIENMISKMTLKTAVMVIPKLHITNTLSLEQIFSELGVHSLFTQNICDLSLMVANGTSETKTNRRLFRVAVAKTNDVAPLIFNRFEGNNSQNPSTTGYRSKRAVTYKVESSFKREIEPLRLKDFILSKRITKHNPGKKLSRNRRQLNPLESIKNLDLLRNSPGLENPQLYVEDVIHKVDLVVNEKGTEGGAATVAYIRRSGTDVVFRADTPFMILIRHDPTKLPLFYGNIYEPTNF